jgi:hypothetical protein
MNTVTSLFVSVGYCIPTQIWERSNQMLYRQGNPLTNGRQWIDDILLVSAFGFWAAVLGGGPVIVVELLSRS